MADSRPTMRVPVPVVILAITLVGCQGAPATPSGRASASGGSPAASVPATQPRPAPAGTPAGTARATPAGTPPTPAPSPPALVPLVPVTGFWSHDRSISRAELSDALAGRAARGRSVYVAAGELDGLAAELGVRAGPRALEVEVGALRAAVAADPAALGILRPEAVTPDLRALAVDGVALFGGTRVRRLEDWPLRVPEPARAPPAAFDPATLWTLAAGGDVMLDRDVYRLAVLEGRGAGFPWDGGTARITDRVCCGFPGFEVVRGERTGSAGAVRRLLAGADLTVVNLENPAPDDFSHHPQGLVFTMDPGLLVGLADAGIDAVSLANNHIGNAGPGGVLETIENVEAAGIRPFGAGADATAARAPAMLTAGGLTVALLGYDGVASSADATASRAGAAALDPAAARADVADARAAGADVVVVVPHWGPEYTDDVTDEQRRIAADLVAAGADVVLGSHSHWAGPLGRVDGRLVVYSMGDLVFDLEHDARTQQGIVVELSFVGPRLAQVDLHPTLILDDAQPNLLEPDGGGNDLLDAIAEASDWP